MIADIQTAADRARADFIDYAVLHANAIGSTTLMRLADDALKVRREPATFWRELRDRLDGWLDAYDRRDAATSVLFNGLAGTLKSDVRWAQEGQRG